MLDLVGFICIQVSKFGHNGRGSFFCSVAMTGFWFTGIMFLLYLFQVVYKAQRIPWLQIEMWFCAIITVFFLIVSALAADMGTGAFIAAAVSVAKKLVLIRYFIECFFLPVFRFLRNVCVRLRCIPEVPDVSRCYGNRAANYRCNNASGLMS